MEGLQSCGPCGAAGHPWPEPWNTIVVHHLPGGPHYYSVRESRVLDRHITVSHPHALRLKSLRVRSYHLTVQSGCRPLHLKFENVTV